MSKAIVKICWGVVLATVVSQSTCGTKVNVHLYMYMKPKQSEWVRKSVERYRGVVGFFGVFFFLGGGMLATVVSQPKCGTKVNLHLYVTYV